MIRGTVYTYAKLPEEAGDDTEWNDVFATFESKMVNGVKTHVVRDTAYVNGVLAEDTLDYFAQDRDGNVWYFGELTYAFEYDDDGNFLGTSTAGSWLANATGCNDANSGDDAGAPSLAARIISAMVQASRPDTLRP